MNCAIVGGGASGLVAGIFALRNGANVTIYEKNSKVGRKILATGNGRCNVTNENIHLSRFHGEDKEFMKSVLSRFSLDECKKFFNHLGLEFFKKENGRYYPLSLQASSVVDVLLHEVKSLGGVVKLESLVESIEKRGDRFSLFVNGKKNLHDRVLIASGSNAMPKLGSSEDGYGFAKHFGHEITPTFASLVQIVCFEDNIQATGVKIVAHVKVLVNKLEKTSAIGDVLFTKYGLSGSAILEVSRVVGLGIMENESVEVHVDCLHGVLREDMVNILTKNAKTYPNKPAILLLNGLINKKLALLILNRLNISPQKTNLNKKEINSISYNVKNLKFTAKNTRGNNYAEVIAGGISTSNIDKNSLQSKLVKGLYFSGEVLNVDGDCGGFNLHWAWSSGFVAGNSLVKK